MSTHIDCSHTHTHTHTHTINELELSSLYSWEHGEKAARKVRAETTKNYFLLLVPVLKSFKKSNLEDGNFHIWKECVGAANDSRENEPSKHTSWYSYTVPMTNQKVSSSSLTLKYFACPLISFHSDDVTQRSRSAYVVRRQHGRINTDKISATRRQH
jgi:hypothetical protein